MKSRAKQITDSRRGERAELKRCGVDLETIETGRVREREAQLSKLTSRNPRHKSRRKNSGADEAAAAAALSESFHGRPAHTVRQVKEAVAERDTLADLGRMLALLIETPAGERVAVRFKSTRLASSPDGGQLYVVGGDQAVDLGVLGLEGSLPKDHLALGVALEIEYHTSKAFHNFEPTDYHHTFGEEGGTLPVVGYDVLSKKLYLIGGDYKVRPEGIVN